MKSLIHAATVVALCATVSRADAQGAFCAEDGHGYRNCGFATMAQCRASLGDMGGACKSNPTATAATEQPTSRKRKRAQPQR